MRSFAQSLLSSTRSERLQKKNEPKPTAEVKHQLGPYKYEPLDQSKNEIRVLGLKSSSNDADPIECSLTRESLGAQNPSSMMGGFLASGDWQSFTALSYTWGEPKFDGRVVIDGQVLCITKNLEAALRQLRKPDDAIVATGYGTPAVTLWWIDAVCINQADVGERNSQVALMRRIYSRASSVRVWLGEEADDSSMAIDIMNQIRNPPPRGPGEAPITYPVVDEETKLRTWKAMRALFRRPWWERAWIRQEVVLTRFPIIQCGSATFDLLTCVIASGVLTYFCRYLNYDPTADSDEPNTETGCTPPWFETPQTLYKFVRDAQAQVYTPLIQLLFHARMLKATDPRDKVFSVLGLADPEVYRIAADYRSTLADVYLQATIAIINKTERLDILSACQSSGRLPGLPSWVPNLDDAWQAKPFPLEQHPSYEADFNFDKGQHILTIRGQCKGSIRAIHTAYVRPDDSNDQLQSTYMAWKKFVGDCGPMFDHLLRRYEHLRNKLLETFNDRAWLDFLSIKTIRSYNLGYKQVSPGNWQLKHPDQSQSCSSLSMTNPLYVKALLVPDSLNENNSHAFFRIHCAMREFCVGRRLGVSSEGAVLLLPQEAQEGDAIAVLEGATFPYILRKQDNGYIVIGEANFHYNNMSYPEQYFDLI